MTFSSSKSNSAYIAVLQNLYEQYKLNPDGIEASWRFLFEDKDYINNLLAAPTHPQPQQTTVTASSDAKSIQQSINAIKLIHAIRERGHLNANLDPLGLAPKQALADLTPSQYGFEKTDLNTPIFIGGALGRDTATINEITGLLQSTYCSSIGIEYMHIQDPTQREWVQERLERNNKPPLTSATKKTALARLTAAECFEKFLHLKFTATKRFGLEGGETMIPAIEHLIDHAAQNGLKEVVMGMAHRGRLNVLTNIIQKPFPAVFAEFHGIYAYPEAVQGSGDVKYHLGASTDRIFGEHKVHLTLNANPSHLEFVNPVVIGRVRAKQQQYSSSTRVTDASLTKVMGLLIHGDAAMAGQGIVAETMMLSNLKGYRTGGTIHFVINNQIGFTTNPKHSRSGVYCTDAAKIIQAPIFHVNGNDVEAVLHVTEIAAEFRQKFLSDVVIDMFCYRRHGHNENDEPAFTQPLMYKKIKELPTTRQIYAQKLIADNILTPDESAQQITLFNEQLEKDLRLATAYQPSKPQWLQGKWKSIVVASGDERSGITGVDPASLRKVGKAITIMPPDFHLNAKIARQIEAKKTMLQTGEGIDWATAEALAFGSLAFEKIPVRLSGQDSKRGTFSHRHAVLFDQDDGHSYTPLRNIAPEQAAFDVHDSPLSELAVMGFDYGFSLVDPNYLVMWEAQFGDFANGAQVMIDQFISTAESKWLRMSGLVLLLPHGYEGQGPDHSSARLERYLQLSAEDNWQVANCSTPANYFHILRRQIKRDFRKPLILMTPKSLLRHPQCVSKLEELETGTRFKRVIGETATNLIEDRLINRVLICSGKLYYDLIAMREKNNLRDVAIIRLEQLYPFPARSLGVEIMRYPNASVFWCQEEPENMGAWTFVDRRIEAVLTEIVHKAKRPTYVGRPESASTACGSLKQHQNEQNNLVNKALTGF